MRHRQPLSPLAGRIRLIPSAQRPVTARAVSGSETLQRSLILAAVRTLLLALLLWCCYCSCAMLHIDVLVPPLCSRQLRQAGQLLRTLQRASCRQAVLLCSLAGLLATHALLHWRLIAQCMLRRAGIERWHSSVKLDCPVRASICCTTLPPLQHICWPCKLEPLLASLHNCAASSAHCCAPQAVS